MKHSILFTALFFISIKMMAQAVNVNADEKIIAGNEADTLIVQKTDGDKAIRLKVFVTGTDKPVAVTVSNVYDLQYTAAKRNTDYNIDDHEIGNLHFSQDNNMTNIINLTILPGNTTGQATYMKLDFKWESLTEKDKQLHKNFYIKIFDKGAAISKSQKKDTGKWRKDLTNTNKIELSQFTDFTGFENDKPNGRLQQEFRFKWGIAKYWHGKAEKLQWQFLRSIIFPDILINRIDKSQKQEVYNYPTYLKGSQNLDSAAPKFTTMDIYKYSNLQIGSRIVLVAFKKDNFRFHLQGGIKLIRNKPYADTSFEQNGKTDSYIFRATYSIAYNVEIYGKTTLSEKNAVNLDFNAGIMWLHLKDSYYRQYDAAVIDAYNKATVLLPVSYPSRHVKPIYMFSARLTKDLSEDKDHYLYFRCNYMYQTGKYNTVEKRVTNNGHVIYIPNPTPERFHNHFLQLQLGLSLDINDLFLKKPEDKKPADSKISDTAG